MKEETMKKPRKQAEIEDLRMRLEEAEEALRAIRNGEVDALVVSSPQGEEVFTLKGADQPYRVFVEAMTEGAATLDPEGTILYCNNRFSEMVGTPPDKVIGSSIYQFIPPADALQFESAFQTGKREEAKVDISFKGEDEGATPAHLSFNALHGQDMPVVCIVATDLTEHKLYEEAILKSHAELEMKVQERTVELSKVNEALRSEIAERKKTEESLRESEQRWATTLASIGDAVIATDANGRIRFMNPVAEGLTGWTLSEASQKPITKVFNIVNEQTREKVDSPVTKVLREGRIAGLANHTLLIRKDGTDVSIDDSGAPIKDQDGEIMGVVLVFRDITQRRQAEEALQASEERFGLSMEATNDGLWDWNAVTDEVYYSPSYYRILGYQPGGFPGTLQAWKERVHPEDLDRAVQVNMDCVEGRSEGFAAEYRMRAQTGEWRWILGRGKCVTRNAQGRAIRLIGTHVDITARKRADEALAESERRYRGIVETAEEGIATHLPDGTITYINERMAGMLGYSREEIIGRSSLDFVDDEEREAVIRARESLKERGSFTKERKLRRKDGSTLWTLSHVSPQRDGAGHFIGYLAMHTDITSRKQVEEALRKSGERFRIAEQLAKMGHFEWDVANDVIVTSSSLERIHGLEPGAFKGGYENWLPMVYSEDRARVNEIVQSAFRAEKGEERFEFRIVRPDGDLRWLSMEATATYDGSGRPLGVMGAMTDITDIKKAQEELIKSRDELEKRVQERTFELSQAAERLRIENIHCRQLETTLRKSETQVRFFASQCLTAQETERKRVAAELHDSIAASLAAIRLRIERITEENDPGPSRTKPLQEIASRIAEINTDVRRIMADLRPSILDDLGIVAAVNWFCREYQKTYAQISVEQEIGIEEREVPDSLKTPIFRICQEAMNNITKYSNANLVNLSLRKEEDKILLTIQDNGQGFNLETVKRGMGLSTMRERAELSGGSFDLESTEGKGTIIRAIWPI